MCANVCARHEHWRGWFRMRTPRRVSGRELAAQHAPMRPGLRVVYISGYTEGVMGHRQMLPGATAMLEKPVTPEALLRKVRSALDAI